MFLILYLKINIFKYARFIIVVSILNLLWIFKFVISTGCLIFPLDFTCFNLDWSMSKDVVKIFRMRL